MTLVLRPVDEVCNLACTYCNAQVYNGAKARMTGELLESIVRQASVPQFRVISFCWHGGEPTLAGLDFYRTARELQRRYFGAAFLSQRCENVIQTNALRLNDAYLAFFAEEGFSVGTSLDGCDTQCNSYRFPSHQADVLLRRTLAAFRSIKEHGLPLVIINVVHDKNAGRAKDIYEFYRDIGADVVSFTPRYLRNGPAADNVRPDAYERFLTEMYDMRERDRAAGRKTFALGVLDQVMRVAEGRVPATCFLSDRCHKFISVNSVGEIFASCTDAAGVLLGYVQSEQLSACIESATRAPHPSIRAQTGMPVDGRLGPGCPKYSDGSRDHYLPVLNNLLQRRIVSSVSTPVNHA